MVKFDFWFMLVRLLCGTANHLNYNHERHAIDPRLLAEVRWKSFRSPSLRTSEAIMGLKSYIVECCYES